MRKSPRLHSVHSHLRERRPVRSYRRGKGFNVPSRHIRRYSPFDQTYLYLKVRSRPLLKTPEIEVYETNNRLLTVVNWTNRQFHALEKHKDPLIYEATKREFLKHAGKINPHPSVGIRQSIVNYFAKLKSEGKIKKIDTTEYQRMIRRYELGTRA